VLALAPQAGGTICAGRKKASLPPLWLGRETSLEGINKFQSTSAYIGSSRLPAVERAAGSLWTFSATGGESVLPPGKSTAVRHLRFRIDDFRSLASEPQGSSSLVGVEAKVLGKTEQ
jgi:hypothetical protein